jgi:hypothetical protein
MDFIDYWVYGSALKTSEPMSFADFVIYWIFVRHDAGLLGFVFLAMLSFSTKKLKRRTQEVLRKFAFTFLPLAAFRLNVLFSSQPRK